MSVGDRQNPKIIFLTNQNLYRTNVLPRRNSSASDREGEADDEHSDDDRQDA